MAEFWQANSSWIFYGIFVIVMVLLHGRMHGHSGHAGHGEHADRPRPESPRDISAANTAHGAHNAPAAGDNSTSRSQTRRGC